MSSQDRSGNTEITRKPRPKIVRTVVTVLIVLLAVFFLRSYLRGGGKPQQTMQSMAPQAPRVVLREVELADLAASREYIGRVEAIQSVSLRPQISGEIVGVHFKDGSLVKAGQALFSIDRKPYQATVDLRLADLAKAEANYERASKYRERLRASDSRSVSGNELDMAESDVLQAKAAISQAKAALKLAEINLGYTRINAPISGRIGKAKFTVGNLVSPAGGELARIVQTNPIRVSFALPDRDYLEQTAAFRSSGTSVYNATIRLADGKAYPFRGERDYEDNAMDEKTGTLMISLRFKNDDGLLVPGSMVSVATKPAKKHVAPVILQESILADEQGDYVYVVDESNVAHQRRVKLGAELGQMREIVSGLRAQEKVIVYGTQFVRPEMTVAPEMMPSAEASKTAVELAKESTKDVPILSSDRSGPTSSDEGKR